MAKPPRKGSFEELIFRKRRVLDSHQTQIFQDSFQVRDKTADQLGLRAVSSIEEAEGERFPWIKHLRRRAQGRQA